MGASVGRRGAGAAVVAVALSIAACGSGGPARPALQVVPIDGQVAGHGYGYWLGQSWLYGFTHSDVMPCATTAPGGKPLAIVGANNVTPGDFSYSCTEPVGVPVYVPAASAGCDSLPGDPGKFGASPAGLLACARAGYRGATASVEINGRTFNANDFEAASPDQSVRAVSGSPFMRSANLQPFRFVAYGGGILFGGLAKGTYTVVVKAVVQHTTFNYTFTVHVS